MAFNPDRWLSYFAKVNFRDDRRVFGILQSDRFFHSYIIGKTGSGKSNLLITLALQDAQLNRGFGIFDVHGDLIQNIWRKLPKHRQADVYYLNIPDPQLRIGYNPFRSVSPEKRSLVASSILEAFKKLWSQAWGIRIEHILRNVFLTLLDQPKADIRDILRILHDPKYRRTCFDRIRSPDIKRFWAYEFPKYSKVDLLPILNKIGAFVVHPAIKRVLIDNKENISLRKIMDKKKIVLVNLSKGALGNDVSYVLGSLLLSSITSAAFSRIDTAESKRVPFHLFLDEFQSYTNLVLTDMLSELRKFKISMTFAHQYLHQLEEEIRHGVLGNVGTIICFRLGAVDAEHMQKELFKEYSPITIGDFVSQPNYHIYLKLMINGKPSKPFSAITLHYSEVMKKARWQYRTKESPAKH